MTSILRLDGGSDALFLFLQQVWHRFCAYTLIPMPQGHRGTLGTVFSGFFADLPAHFLLGSPNKLIWNPLSNSICLQILSFVPSRKYTGFDFFLRVFQISLISFLNQKCSKISLPTKLLSTFNDDIESRKTPSRLLSSIYLVP